MLLEQYFPCYEVVEHNDHCSYYLRDRIVYAEHIRSYPHEQFCQAKAYDAQYDEYHELHSFVLTVPTRIVDPECA